MSRIWKVNLVSNAEKYMRDLIGKYKGKKRKMRVEDVPLVCSKHGKNRMCFSMNINRPRAYCGETPCSSEVETRLEANNG